MVQAPWGGGYDDPVETRRNVEAQFDRCAALIAAMDRARSQGLMTARPGRLVVFESDFRPFFRWGWLNRALDADTASDWMHDHRIKEDESGVDEDELPTNAARRWLEQLSMTGRRGDTE